MFDKHVYQHESKVVAVTKEIEKTISPDKVVEMYNDIREELSRNILKKLVLRGNEFNGSCVAFSEPDRLSVLIRGHFDLNGKPYTFSFRQDENEAVLTRDGLKAILFEKVAAAIAVTLTKSL